MFVSFSLKYIHQLQSLQINVYRNLGFEPKYGSFQHVAKWKAKKITFELLHHSRNEGRTENNARILYGTALGRHDGDRITKWRKIDLTHVSENLGNNIIIYICTYLTRNCDASEIRQVIFYHWYTEFWSIEFKHVIMYRMCPDCHHGRIRRKFYVSNTVYDARR